jgi:GT2 family glycosyltransferase
MDIPIIIVSYNNYKYVENTIRQIKKVNENYLKNIIVMDNCSTCDETIKYLDVITDSLKVIRNKTNEGPWVSPVRNRGIWETMPEKYILTDPDLEFNENLPSDFIEQMVKLSEKYDTSKIGFALRIDDYSQIYQEIYFQGKTIVDWENQFWINKITSETEYELYRGEIDTTFCLTTKSKQDGKNWFAGNMIRIAGCFTARHLPWYIDYGILSMQEKYDMYSKQTKISGTSKIIMEYIDKHYDKEECNGSIVKKKKVI